MKTLIKLHDLVMVLYGAYYAFKTIDVQWKYHYDNDTFMRLWNEWVEQKPPNNTILTTNASIEQLPQPKIRSVYQRVWWRKPDCWRSEYELESGNNLISIYCGEEWWSYTSGTNIVNTNKIPEGNWGNYKFNVVNGSDFHNHIARTSVVDPSFLLLSHELEVTGVATHAGRGAVAVRAVYHKNKDHLREEAFWAMADEYHLLVDQEYGILLRYGAILHGKEFAVSSVDSVIYNEPIPDKVFQFSPA
jgi:outer membrane lipoprotein-sorting protein